MGTKLAAFWKAIKMPHQLEDLSMEQISAVRKLVQMAYQEWKRNAC